MAEPAEPEAAAEPEPAARIEPYADNVATGVQKELPTCGYWTPDVDAASSRLRIAATGGNARWADTRAGTAGRAEILPVGPGGALAFKSAVRRRKNQRRRRGREIRSASAGTTNDDDFSEAQEAELAEASAAFQAAQSKARDDAILGEILALRRSHGR